MGEGKVQRYFRGEYGMVAYGPEHAAWPDWCHKETAFWIAEADYAALQAKLEAAERDAYKADLLRRVVMFAKGHRAPAWMPQRFLDECREVVGDEAPRLTLPAAIAHDAEAPNGD